MVDCALSVTHCLRSSKLRRNCSSVNPRANKALCGSGLSFRLDDLNSVGEPYTENYFRQLVVAIEARPTFLGLLGQLEDHGERGLVRETSFGAHCSVADRRE